MGKKGSTGVIVFVSNTSWSIFNFRLGLIRELLSHGFCVWVLAPRDHYTEALTAAGVAYHPLQLDQYGRNPFREVGSLLQLWWLYKKIQPDLVIHYTIKPNIYGSIAAQLSGIPSMAMVTGLGRLWTGKGRLRPILAKLYKLGLSCSTTVGFLNASDERCFREFGLLRSDKSFVLPGEGIDTNHFRPGAAIVPQRDCPSFLYAGRMLREKGLYELVGAARNLRRDFPGLRIFLIGFVRESHPGAIGIRQIRKWEKEGILRYLGRTRDIRPYLSRTDCLVSPSYREGMSRIIMEASAMEIPVITTESIGCADLVLEGETGLLCRPADAESLEFAMRRFLALSTDARKEMGRAARQLMVAKFEEKKVIRQFLHQLDPFFREYSPDTVPLTLNSCS